MPVDGTWKCTMDSPMGAQEVIFVFATKGSELNGTMIQPEASSSPAPDMKLSQRVMMAVMKVTQKLSRRPPPPAGGVEFQGGTVNGNDLSWTVSLESPMKLDLTMKATVQGNALTGGAQAGRFGTSKLTGTRV